MKNRNQIAKIRYGARPDLYFLVPIVCKTCGGCRDILGDHRKIDVAGPLNGAPIYWGDHQDN